MSIDLTFEELYQKLKNPNFGTSLGGELPIFIQPLPPNHQMESEKEIKRLMSRLDRVGIKVEAVNLFDIVISILQEENILDPILQEEANFSKMDIIATFDGVLDIQSVILPKLKAIIQASHPDFLFISGVGSVYPFIRSHGILNNIEILTEEKSKIVLFFPGKYDNLQLKLFGHIWDENYYRGLNLNEISIQ